MLKGKDLEALLLFRAEKLEEAKIMSLGRYGVQVTYRKDEKGQMMMQPMHSLPDFEGVIFGTGRQIIIETKVCSQASYPIYATGQKHPRQIDHMLKRSQFGALCFLLIHFNERELVRTQSPAVTYALPVHPNTNFWREYKAGERKSVTRGDCELYATQIPWNIWGPRAHKETPDIGVLIWRPETLPL